MRAEPEIFYGQLITSLTENLAREGFSSTYIPDAIISLLEDNTKEDRKYLKSKIMQTGEYRTFKTFKQFVETHRPLGLGIELNQLKELCSRNDNAIELIDREEVWDGRQGGNGSNQYQSKANPDNVSNCSIDYGNSKQSGIRRLRKDRPDLLEQVLNNEMSVNKAMIQAGFRKKTITIPLDIFDIARILKKHLDHEKIKKLSDILLDKNNMSH